MTNSSYSNYEKGCSEPPVETILKFCDILGITLNDFLEVKILDIPNAQIATFIPDWNKVNQQLADGLMDEEEYKMWLEDTLKLFNVPIEDFIWE